MDRWTRLNRVPMPGEHFAPNLEVESIGNIQGDPECPFGVFFTQDPNDENPGLEDIWLVYPKELVLSGARWYQSLGYKVTEIRAVYRLEGCELSDNWKLDRVRTPEDL